ncbi:hypothetical protein [Pseudonocardia nigra]|uniref:hypothetical protein n=1 Tax=Pseudonocardia nigra TaxID=1921578 RepID=UPI001C5D2E28|nr:hypothetical protein [Pseudonocardia nigra]
MSEYQYYEFAAVDRPLGDRDLDALRGLSTRAHITPTSFVNTYEWGSFSGDPRRLVERYFDAFLYLANWGTRELIVRLPARLVDPDIAQRYCSGDAVSAWTTGDHVVIAAVSEDEEGDFDWGGEGVLASILPVRAELLAGDVRALYLLWLLGVQVGEVPDDAVEPPVPASLDHLSGSQTALVEFLRIDRDLVEVAAVASPSMHEAGVDVARWVAGLSGSERDALLVGLLEGGDPLLRAETLRRAGPGRRDGAGVRTAAELLDQASGQRERREQAERDRRAARSAESARWAEVARRERLAGLAAEGDGAWARVAARIAEKNSSGYDVAVDLLVDLREVCDPAVFASRLKYLRREHGRKVTFVERLGHAGL